MIVIDASLAVKWVLWEDQSSEALHFLSANRAQLCAPDLIAVEVAGAITRVARMVNLDPHDTRRMLASWLGDFGAAAVDMRRSPPSLVKAAAGLSADLSHPIQDCLYLALAIDLEADLATCDAKFHRKAVDAHPRVKLLSNYVQQAALTVS